MLPLEWADLASVSAEITHLESQRQAAKMMANANRAAALSNELARATTERDRLVLRITERIGAGALVDVPPCHPPRAILLQ